MPRGANGGTRRSSRRFRGDGARRPARRRQQTVRARARGRRCIVVDRAASFLSLGSSGCARDDASGHGGSSPRRGRVYAGRGRHARSSQSARPWCLRTSRCSALNVSTTSHSVSGWSAGPSAEVSSRVRAELELVELEARRTRDPPLSGGQKQRVEIARACQRPRAPARRSAGSVTEAPTPYAGEPKRLQPRSGRSSCTSPTQGEALRCTTVSPEADGRFEQIGTSPRYPRSPLEVSGYVHRRSQYLDGVIRSARTRLSRRGRGALA